MKSLKAIFITVSYNNYVSTEKYIHSFLKLEDNEECVLIVVDNSTKKDENLIKVIQEINNVVYLRQNSNNGYMSACNYGYLYAKENLNIDSNVIIYSNNDIYFKTYNLISIINNKFSNNDKLGVISPSIYDTQTHNELNPFLSFRPTNSQMMKLKAIYKSYLFCYIINLISKIKNKMKTKKSLSIDSLYATHGAIFIMSKRLLNDLPDDGYFLYGEEITIAEICRTKKLNIEFVNEIKIVHESHATTGRTFSYKEFLFKKRAIEYINQKYNWN